MIDFELINMPIIDPQIFGVARYFLAGFFCLSGLHKFSHRHAFKDVLSDYQLLPRKIIAVTSMVIPLIEIIVGISFLFPDSLAIAATTAALLLSTYGFAMAINLYRGRSHIDCGCTFQQQKTLLSYWHLLRNALLISASLLVHLPIANRNMHSLDIVNMITAIVGLTLIYLISEILLANHAHLKLEKNNA